MEKDEIGLLEEEEMVKLSIKSSLVVPSGKATLVGSIWTKKPYNPDSLRAQLKSIWKMKKIEV